MAKDFARAAARFCSVIERVDPSSRASWLSSVESSLAEVYASAVNLPQVGPATEEPVSRMSTDEWSSVFSALQSKIGSDDAYWRVSDPGDPASVVRASLADDLAEVYRALSAGLGALRSGAAPDDVMFEWRLGFDSQWASHAVAALGALIAVRKNL